MRRITQTILADPARPDVQGNCLQAALASILDLPLTEVPHFVQDDHDHPDDPERHWFTRMLAWLDARGLNLRDGSNAPSGSLVLALGTSPRGLGHIVIQRDGEMVHDPHPDRTGLVDVSTTWRFVDEVRDV